jgi:MFS family permease
MNVVFVVANIIGAGLMTNRKIKAKNLMVFGMTLYGLSLFLASLVSNFYTFMILYILCSGIGLGIVFTVPIHIAW